MQGNTIDTELPFWRSNPSCKGMSSMIFTQHKEVEPEGTNPLYTCQNHFTAVDPQTLSTVRPALLWVFSEFGTVCKYPDLLTYLLTVVSCDKLDEVL